MRVWLLAPVRDRMGGERPCPSTGTPWAASRSASTVTWWLLPDVLVRIGSSRHSRRSLWRGCGCICSSLAAVPTCSASRSVQHPPVGGLHRPCGREALLTTLTTRRFSLLTNDGFCTRFAVPAEPPLLSPTRARHCPPASSACATLSPQCDEPSLHRVHPRLLQEGTARSAVPSDRARGVWRCRPCRCAAATIR